MDLTEFMNEITVPVIGEMMSRLEMPLSDRDVAAVSSAITKAVHRGMLRGVIQGADEIGEQCRAIVERETGQRVELDVNLDFEAEVVDLWAELYGDDEDAGS